MNRAEEAAYQYTNSWFDSVAKEVWDALIPRLDPTKILEIGSYEGASACYLIEKLANKKNIELHCVDTWAGGIEHQAGGTVETDMSYVETRFLHNLKVAGSRVTKTAQVVVHKDLSYKALAGLIVEGREGYFDFIYVDGSHQAPDVLCDAILAFQLLRVGGIIAFDDYLWHEELPYGIDPLRCPKPAIDAFTNLFCRRIKIINAPLYQLFIQKTAD